MISRFHQKTIFVSANNRPGCVEGKCSATLATDGAAKIIFFIQFSLPPHATSTHVSRVAPDWGLWRTLYQTHYSATAGLTSCFYNNETFFDTVTKNGLVPAFFLAWDSWWRCVAWRRASTSWGSSVPSNGWTTSGSSWRSPARRQLRPSAEKSNNSGWEVAVASIAFRQILSRLKCWDWKSHYMTIRPTQVGFKGWYVNSNYWTRSYKHILSIDLFYAGILAL